MISESGSVSSQVQKGLPADEILFFLNESLKSLRTRKDHGKYHRTLQEMRRIRDTHFKRQEQQLAS